MKTSQSNSLISICWLYCFCILSSAQQGIDFLVIKFQHIWQQMKSLGIPVLNFEKQYFSKELRKTFPWKLFKNFYFLIYLYWTASVFFFLVKWMMKLLRGCHLSNELCVFFLKPDSGAYSARQLGWSYPEKTQEQTI